MFSRNPQNKKAQVSSIDALVAAGILVIIIIVYVTLFTNLLNKPFLVKERDSLENNNQKLVSTLLSSAGSRNWSLQENISSVTSISLLDHQGNLDLGRVLKLKEFVNANYDEVKEFFGIEKYDLYINIKKPHSFKTTKEGFLDLNSNVAYTRAEGSPSEGDAVKFGLKDFLISNNVSFIDYDNRWEDLINEINQFDIVIFEDPHVKDSVLSIEQRDILQNWVRNGGVYVQKEHGTIIEIFDVKTNKGAKENGIVIALDSILRNVSIGDIVKVREGYRLSKNSGEITTLVVHQASEHTLFGYWDYGFGLVYYIPDTEGSVEDPEGIIVQTDLRSILTLHSLEETGYTLNNSQLEIGFAPLNATEVTIIHDTVLVEENEEARISFTLWK